MNAKHSAILLSGLLLLMIGIAWAQSPSTARPTCPPVEDEIVQYMLQPTTWVRADRNANTSRWDIDCREMRDMENIPMSNATHNATSNARNSIPVIPGRTPRRSNGNYVNTNPYNSAHYPNFNINVNANMAANSVNARPARPVRREPNTRRP